MPTIQKRGDTYRIRVSDGYDAQGKQIMRSMTWSPTPGMTEKQIEKELNRQATLFEEKVRSGRYMDGNVKFQEFAERWFQDYGKEHLRERTYYRYAELSKRTYTAIGHIRLDKLQPQHLLEFYAQLAEPGQNMRTGGGLAPKTIKHYHTFISSVMERAVKWGLVENNPCRRIDAPKVDRHEIECMNDEEAVIFLERLQDEPIEYRVMFTLLLFTGIRRGELMGLEWPDIDINRSIIAIRRTSQYLTGKGIYVDDTKTEKSQRAIKVPADVIDLLREYKVLQSERKIKVGDQWDKEWTASPRLFTQWNGKPMHLNTPYNYLLKFLEKNGMRKVNLHSLRHTHATLMINQGVSVRTVSGRLGHSQTSTTMNIYAHYLQSADEAASEAVEMVLKGKKRAGYSVIE